MGVLRRRIGPVSGFAAGSRAARLLLAGAVAATALLPSAAASGAATRAANTPTALTVPGDTSGCGPYRRLVEKLELTGEGRLLIPPLPGWRLPDNPTWRENPFRDKYWQIRYQSLRYVEHEIARWCADGAAASLDRATFLMRDWLADNPRGAAARWAWYDHPVAWRTFVFVRAARLLPAETWLVEAIDVHGEWLAAYRGVGNHALNAYRGLLQAGCFRGRQDWIDLAVRRMNSLLRESIDGQGVTNEQAVAYQDYNFRLYNEARDELLACGQPESPYFHRVTLMPNLLAHATLPNGEYEMLGNTYRAAAMAVPGTVAEFAATQGRSGPRPSSTDAVFRRGFAFVRSGWGEDVAYQSELMLSVRFGAGRAFHGHDDGGALTLYGHGSRLLLDSGRNSFQGAQPWTDYFVGRSAHNVVTIDGLEYGRQATTTMTPVLGERAALFVLGNDGYAGVDNRRSILYSRTGRYVIVDDHLTADQLRTFRQAWHLAPDADPALHPGRVVTRGPRGKVAIIQLALGGSTRIVTGARQPTQGWLSYEYKQVVAAPTVEHVRRGVTARYITLLVPFRRSLDASATVVAQWSDGYQVDVTIGDRTERVTVRGSAMNISRPGATPPGPTPVGGGTATGAAVFRSYAAS